MLHFNRWTCGVAIVLVFGVATGCGSSSGQDNGTVPDVSAEVAPDVIGEVASDVVADVAAEVASDVVADVAAEVPADVVADVAADVVEDAMPDVAWETLPRLPEGLVITADFAAGAAQKDVSPTQPTHLGGFGFCLGDETVCRSTDGVHDPLLASTVAIADPKSGEVVMFIGVDTIGVLRSDVEDMHRRIQKRLYEQYGVYFPGERAMIGASHAHSSCDTVGLWGPMMGAGRQEQYVELLKNGVVDSAAEAFGKLVDVTMDWGKGSWVNSDEDGFTHDNDLFVLRGKGTDDNTVFTLVRFPAHPTTYGDKMHAASADFVGTMRLKLEKDLGGLNVFMNGPIGSVYPERPNECGLTEEAFPNGDRTTTTMDPADYMKTTCTGYGIAEVVKTALTTSTPLVATNGITFKHTKFHFHPTNGTLMMLAEVGPLPFDNVNVDDPEAMMYSIFSVATVGDLTYITTPGESFPSFGDEAKKIAVEANLPNPIVLGLTQDWMGYLLLEKQWKDANLSYHQSLSPGETVEPTFMAAMRKLLGLPAAPPVK
jgi:hypothetical protein